MKRVTITSRTPDGKTEIRVYSQEDPGRRSVNDNLRDTNRRLFAAYREAANDLLAKQFEWTHRHEARVARYQAELRAGLITQADYEAWMRGQLFQQRAWALKRGQLIRIMQATDDHALDLIARGRLAVFADNANYMLYRIDRVAGLTGTFGLYNTDAVMRLMRDQPDMLRRPGIDKQKSYDWYNRIISGAIAQGILQGETLDQIALRISQETGEKALDVLRRNARTAYVGAMNAGNLQAMRDAEATGLRLKKQWMATLDAHTRDSHENLDSQTADIDEPFESLLGKIMYPGDPSADPKNVYNCRCWLREYYEDAPDRPDRWDASGNHVGDVTYAEWLEEYGGGD